MLPIILFFAWLGVVLCLKKINMHAFLFIFGSVGLFFFLMYLGLESVEKQLEFLITYILGEIGRVTGLFTAYPEYSMISIFLDKQAVTFFVDYECSGFIETLVYLCLVAFFPVYSYWEKGLCMLAGSIYILFSNLFRVLMICLLIKSFGVQIFYFAHTIFARLLFFALSLLLYYFVFTKPHILKQRVGNLTYDGK